MPSRRERSSPLPVRPKIEQVFTSTNTHRHRTPHPGYHAAHTAMASGQHQATGSAQEHRATTTRAATPASKTLTPPHPRPAATPTKEMSGKARLSHPWAAPVPRPNRPVKTSLHRSVLQHRARDEFGPTAGREMSMVLSLGARRVGPAAVRETSSVLRPGVRRARSCCTGREISDGLSLGEANPSTKVTPGRRGEDGRPSNHHRREPPP